MKVPVKRGFVKDEEDKNMKTRKVIENRKVYIDSKNGLRYNMNGQRTK